MSKLKQIWNALKSTTPEPSITVHRVNLNEHADAIVVRRGKAPVVLGRNDFTIVDPDHNVVAEAQEKLAILSSEGEENAAMVAASKNENPVTTVVFANMIRFRMTDDEIANCVNRHFNGRAFPDIAPPDKPANDAPKLALVNPPRRSFTIVGN